VIRLPLPAGFLRTSLLAWSLLVSTGAAAAPTWSAAGQATLAAPQDTAVLQAFAVELGKNDVMVEEAVLGFRQLLATRKLEGSLERDLATLLLSRPVEPGWRDLYLKLAAAAADEDESFAWQVRAAQARLRGEAVKDAVKDLAALHKARPDRLDAGLLLGHALLKTGDAKGAEAVFRTFPKSPEAREGLVLATLPAAVEDAEPYWRDRMTAAGVGDRIDSALAGIAADATDARVSALRSAFLAASGPAPVRVALPIGESEALFSGAKSTSRLIRAAALMAYGYDLAAVGILKESAPAGNADNAAVQGQLGRALLNLGDFTNAVAAFERGLQIAPGDTELVNGLARALLGVKKYDEALKLIGTTDATLAGQIRAAQTAAAVLATPARTDDIEGLRAAWTLDPSNATIAGQLGARLFDEGAVEASKAPLRAAALANPRDAAIVTRYVNAAVTTGESLAAIEASRRTIGATLSDTERTALSGSLAYAWVKRAEELRRSGSIYEVADAYAVAHLLNPKDPGMLRALGGAYWSAGKLEDAWTAYVHAFQMDPKDKDGLNALVGLGAQLKRQDDVRSLLGGVSDDPSVRGVLRDLDFQLELAAANEALRRGELDNAWGQFLRLQAKDPSSPDVLRGMASVKLAQGDQAGALELFRKARASRPDDPWALLGEANALIAADQLGAAQAVLDELGEPSDVGLYTEARRARVRLLVKQAQIDMKADRDTAAWQALSTALEIEGDTWVCHNLGTLYAKHRQWDLAQAFFDEAYFLDASNLYPRLGKAGLLIERGWHEEAQTILDQLPSTDADVIAARRALEVARAQREADVARRIGDEKEARKIIEAVYARYPEDPYARAAWENEQLGSSDPEEVLAAARAILLSDPVNERALGSALGAAHRMGKTDTIVPLYETAAARGGPKEKVWLDRARITASTEKALDMHADARHDDAVELLEALEERAGVDVAAWSIIGGAWLEIRETKRALEAFDEALSIDAADSAALVGKAGTLSSMGRSTEGIDLLESAWQTSRDPSVGLGLAELYRARNQLKQVDRVLAELDATPNDPPPVDPLPALRLPSGAEPQPLAAAPRAYVLAPEQEARRRELREASPGGVWRPAFDLGAGTYGRKGFAGWNHLLGFFLPVRLHELRAGPVAFDVEAVPYFLSDAQDEAYGALLTAGIQAGVGPVGVHLRGGTSPVGFRTSPYFIWYGSLDIRASEQVALGLVTSREPVTDTLTSWAGKDSAQGYFGRVHRTGFGGYLNVTPTDADRIQLYGRGGWNDGLKMERVAFWEAMLAGGHDFKWTNFDLRLGGNLFGMSFTQQVDKFFPSQGGFFSPQLFVSGAAKIETHYRTPNDRLSLCVGGNLGAQYIQVDYSGQPEEYIRPGVFFGYAANAALDWRVARFWWLGLDGSYIRNGDWYQGTGMVHVHYGPNNAWERHNATIFSPLAGQPIVQGQPCGN
jgi:tetratricopeptide (TPR) repeat protein